MAQLHNRRELRGVNDRYGLGGLGSASSMHFLRVWLDAKFVLYPMEALSGSPWRPSAMKSPRKKETRRVGGFLREWRRGDSNP